MNALIFDIDGTLMNSHGLGRKAFEEALNCVTGIRVDMSGVDWLGRTDREILTQVLDEHQFGGKEIEKCLPEIFRVFNRQFAEFSRQHPEKFSAYPYVKGFLDKVRDRPLGLLTGNVMETAHLKLGMVGIGDFFPFGIGGYGNESADRNALFPVALNRMKKHYQVREFDRVFVIGDSHRDIECAKKNGAVSIAVSTGKMDRSDLLSHTPDYLFRNFREMSAILDIL